MKFSSSPPPTRRRHPNLRPSRNQFAEVDVTVIDATTADRAKNGAFRRGPSSKRMPLPSWRNLVIPTIVIATSYFHPSRSRQWNLPNYFANTSFSASNENKMAKQSFHDANDRSDRKRYKKLLVEAVDAPTVHNKPHQGRGPAAAPFPMEGSFATGDESNYSSQHVMNGHRYNSDNDNDRHEIDDNNINNSRLKGSKTGLDATHKDNSHKDILTPGNYPSLHEKFIHEKESEIGRGSNNNESGNNFSNKSQQRHKHRQKQRQKHQTNQQQNMQQPPQQPPSYLEEQFHPASNQKTTTKQRVTSSQHIPRQDYKTYMHWCETVLGIQSVVEIKDFEYIDHLAIQWEENRRASESHSPDVRRFDWLEDYHHHRDSDADSHEGHNDKRSAAPPAGRSQPTSTISADTPPITTTIRGLAAKHAINIGDIVISIPTNALLSIPTTIDRDPVLSRLLGPSSRQRYGWTDHSLEYEVPLLIIAILYHDSLGMDSHLWHYIDILKGAPTEEFLFLWNEEEWRWGRGARGEIGEGVKELAKGIREDVYDMYDLVMGTLVREHPGVFGPPPRRKRKDDDASITEEEEEEEEEEGWTYSFDNFQWAFAMVVSRHHYLPVREWDDDYGDKRHNGGNNNTRKRHKEVKKSDSSSQMQETLSTVSEMPPANQPTDSWVEEAHFQERGIEEPTAKEEEDEVSSTEEDDDSIAYFPTKHPFLAPLADLINFGPPCLTGSYNPEEHAFEFIATCSFEVGQEVTFWYSSECSDVIIANYGFLHPLVPPCPAPPPKDDGETVQEWKARAKHLEEQLWDAYTDMDLLKDELIVMQSQLISCGCEDAVAIDRLAEENDVENADRKSTMPTENLQLLQEKRENLISSRRKESHTTLGVRGSLHGVDGVRRMKGHERDVEDLGL